MILLTESFQAYRQKKGFNEITVDAVASASSCCRIWVPKVSIGAPTESLDSYRVIQDHDMTFYITNNLTLEAKVTFSYQELLGRSRIEMLGYQINRVMGFIL